MKTAPRTCSFPVPQRAALDCRTARRRRGPRSRRCPSPALARSPGAARSTARGRRFALEGSPEPRAWSRERLDEGSSLGELNGGLLRRELLEELSEVILPD